MPLPTPADREFYHRRTVTCEGYRRTDGLWDIEGHLVDIKANPIPLPDKPNGILPVGEPLHDMGMRITIDLDLKIHQVETTMDSTPYSTCNTITNTFKQLEGHTIKPGFTKLVRDLFGGIQGCTHLVELLGPIATTAYQVTFQERHLNAKDVASSPVSNQINSCHTYDAKGAVVEKYWPELFEGNK